ncbi:nitrate reductase [Acidovorax soli]|jgi:assimilatory nitrate reductase catalytic subunit
METRSTCPYCGVGCGVLIEHDGQQITGVRGDPEHPANFGRLCTKGSTLHLTATPLVLQQQRLREPMKRAARGEAAQPIGWEQAEREIAERLLDIRAAHGPEAIGVYISGQLLTEDYHAFNKLARAVLGTPHIDSNSRLCMSSAVVGYKQSLGADAPPCSYEDIELADCVLISGANPAWAHPILFRRLEAARAAKPGHKLIVIDPRRTETAELADLHLQLRPGTDVALCHGLLHALIWQGLVDRAYIDAHTEGFEALKALVRDWTPARAAQVCGLREADIWQAAEWFGRAPASLSLYCQGLNQSSHGTANNSTLINLHLATGQIGRPGAGPFSLTGQPNAMGGRESGGMATLLPGHRDPARAEDWAALCKLWGVADLPSRRGHTAVEMFEAAARGEIKALWIVCTNPAQSLPDQARVREALARCELVIVQEAFAHTATARFADYLLPAATWGEKDGTVTNSERRISRVRAAVPPPGQARPDWRIARDIALRLDAALERPPRLAADSAEALWQEHREATRGRDLDITGLSWAILDRDGPQHWPYVAGPTPRLYTDGRFATPSGRARFIAPAVAPNAEATSAQHPFALTTSRLRDQWHGMSRSGSVPRLFAHDGRPSVRLHPADAARRKLAEGELVTVRSRRGAVVLPLRLDPSLPPAGADLPMHWGEEFIGAQAGINALTQGAACPESRQPELKFSAVAIESTALPWRISACAWVAPAQGPALRERLRALMPRFGYAQCLPEPAGGELAGWAFEAASAEAPAPELIAAVSAALGLDAGTALRYADPQRGRLRLLALDGDDMQAAPLRALLRVGQHDEGAWLVDLWRARTAASTVGRWLLSPGAPPNSLPVASPQVCNCFDVREDTIRTTLARCSGSPTERLAQLQAERRCGTQCGSCLPALRRLVTTTPEEIPA